MARLLLIESFYTGSHKQLVDLIHEKITDSHLYTLPGKKWHWRARTSALWFGQQIPRDHHYRTLFASSVLNLAELVAMRPDLLPLHKVLYFHENQLCYPVQVHKDRDFQYGYNQIISCLAADTVVFNSQYNLDSFLTNIPSFLKLMPDFRPKGITEQIRCRCKVLHFPIVYPTFRCRECEQCGASDDRTSARVSPSPDVLNCQGQSHTSSDYGNVNRQVNLGEDNYRGKKTSDSSESHSLSESPARSEEKMLLADSNIQHQSLSLHLVSSQDRKVEDGDSKSKCCGSSVTKQERCDIQCISTGDSKENELQRKQCRLMESEDTNHPLHILWPHRWEHDKNPETFFKVLVQLQDSGCDFRLSVLGENFKDNPAIFEESYITLRDKIVAWGYQESKQDYFTILHKADVVVSTSNHEFFGVAMLEAVHMGCYPLVPNRLVYPEIFPEEYLYNTDNQLLKKLKNFCKNPAMLRRKKIQVDTEQYSWDSLKDKYMELISVTRG